MQCDILIQQGEVIDPSQSIRGIYDLAVSNGKILKLAPKLDHFDANHIIDARGLYVVPGMIDFHVHVYPHHTKLGLNADELSPAGGVTTMIDTGSAGSHNFEGFYRDYIRRARTEILALVNISRIGLVPFIHGELLDANYLDREGCIKEIEEKDCAIGAKIRASKSIIGEGSQGWRAFREAVAAARESKTWLMVHIGDSPMTVLEMLEHLQPGDCITHCYRGGSTRVLDENGKIHSAILDAAQSGVLFDIGHGAGSFEWETAETAFDQGFEPTTISTDLHIMNVHGPVYDMPTTLSKFLLMGMPLERAIECATSAPAAALKRTDIGTLREGTVADITILEKQTGEFTFHDSHWTPRKGETLLVAATTIRRGEIIPGGGGLNPGRGLAPSNPLAG